VEWAGGLLTGGQRCGQVSIQDRLSRVNYPQLASLHVWLAAFSDSMAAFSTEPLLCSLPSEAGSDWRAAHRGAITVHRPGMPSPRSVPW
jgi:hypothetical protein